MSRILPDEERRKVVDRRLDDTRPARAFADAGNALIGIDFQKKPVPGASELLRGSAAGTMIGSPVGRVGLTDLHEKCADSGDFHL